MAVLSAIQHVTFTVDGVVYVMGSTNTAQTLTVGSTSELVYDQTYEVASSTAAPNASAVATQIYSSSTQATFDFLGIESTTDGLIQIVVNENDAAESSIVMEIKAGIPQFFFSDTGMHGTLANTDTWEVDFSLDVIDRIEFHQSTGAAAKVRVLAISD